MSKRTFNKIKKAFLDSLPRVWAKKLYLIRNFPIILQGEPLEGIYIKLAVNNRDKLWQERMARKWGHERGICEWLKTYLNDQDILFDVGSNYGFFPALITTLNKNVEIHAFEASWIMDIFLRKTAEYYLTDSVHWTINNILLDEKSGPKKLSLDDYCQAHQVTPTLIKMDVDGFEYRILKGASTLISKNQTEILVEIHPEILARQGVTVDHVLELFPPDFSKKVLGDIRTGNRQWSTDLDLLKSDPNPYLYVAPPEIARF